MYPVEFNSTQKSRASTLQLRFTACRVFGVWRAGNGGVRPRTGCVVGDMELFALFHSYRCSVQYPRAFPVDDGYTTQPPARNCPANRITELARQASLHNESWSFRNTEIEWGLHAAFPQRKAMFVEK